MFQGAAIRVRCSEKLKRLPILDTGGVYKRTYLKITTKYYYWNSAPSLWHYFWMILLDFVFNCVPIFHEINFVKWIRDIEKLHKKVLHVSSLCHIKWVFKGKNCGLSSPLISNIWHFRYSFNIDQHINNAWIIKNL